MVGPIALFQVTLLYATSLHFLWHNSAYFAPLAPVIQTEIISLALISNQHCIEIKPSNAARQFDAAFYWVVDFEHISTTNTTKLIKKDNIRTYNEYRLIIGRIIKSGYRIWLAKCHSFACYSMNNDIKPILRQFCTPFIRMFPIKFRYKYDFLYPYEGTQLR